MSSAAPSLRLASAAAPANPWPVSVRLCLLPALAAAAWHVLLLAGYLLPFGGDPSVLVCTAKGSAGRWPYEAISIGFGRDGFDGQFYYALARNPWRLHGEPLDRPAYRHARLLYPALAWLLSGGGDPVRLLLALPALNVLAAAGLAWLGTLLAIRHGRSAWWGFLLPLVVNVALPAMRDLTDPLAALTACGLLTAWLLRWRAWVVFAWAAAAMLAREQNAVVVLVVLAATLCHRRWRTAAGLVASLLLLVGWFAVLTVAYGSAPFGSDNVGLPFAGMLDHWVRPDGFASTRARAGQALGMLTLGVQMGLCVATAFFRANRSVKLLALAGALLAVVAGPAVYGDEWSYLRVFYWMPLGVWVGSITSGLRWPVILLSPVVVWPCLMVERALRVWLK
ncbi:MAG TPA: hypothetical protein VKA46_30125 [Gemmataceae bacterium]|nr:hypothetical protein [Gemmataceae bacterium]